MKSEHFYDSKLKFAKVLLFRLFHETETPTACCCSTFICGRAYPISKSFVNGIIIFHTNMTWL